MKHGYQNLIAYQKAEELVISIYKLAASLPKEELYGLTSQLKRAALSVPANLAEGYCRSGEKEKIRFYNIAQGSLAETECFINLATRLNMVDKKDSNKILLIKDEVGKLLHGLTKVINQSLLTASSKL